MKYVYGPVKSRRLGNSLGLSLTPYKVCDFDCMYCQLGSTQAVTAERKEYIKIDEILNELNSWLQNNQQEAKDLNYITISGSGEPTLNTKIGDLIGGIKKKAAVPIAVITNASLLSEPEVRRALINADLIVPSLDSVVPEIFEQINRPAKNIRIEDIIEGLISLRKEFRGKIWLEIMIVKGANDDLDQIRKLKEVIDLINADKIQVNSPVRTPAGANIFAADKRKLNKICEILGEKCEVI